MSVKNYKEYSETFTPIEIEIIPTKGKYGSFIYIDENDKLYYHIYFNDDKEEIKNKYKTYTEDGMIKHEYYIDEEDKVTKTENNGEITSLSNKDKNYITQMEKEARKLELSNELLKIYSDLYDYSRNGYSKPIVRNSSIDYLPKYKNSKICVCSIGKNENLYIKEFVEYYKSIGIDKIFIYDNNDIQGESFETVLEDYKKNIINFLIE